MIKTFRLFPSEFYEGANKNYYEDDYVYYIVSKIIRDNNFNVTELVVYCDNFYQRNLNVRQFKFFIKENFATHNTPSKLHAYYLTEEQISQLTIIEKFVETFDAVTSLDEHENVNVIKQFFARQSFDFSQLAPYVLAFDKCKTNRPKEFYISLFISFIRNKDDNLCSLEDLLSKVNQVTTEIPLFVLFGKTTINELFIANSLYYFNDVKDLPLDVFASISILNFDLVYKCINSILLTNEEFINDLRISISSIKQHNLEVINYRYSQNKKTLEEIASIYNLTRERIRQIELKTTIKILEATENLASEAYLFFHNNVKGHEKRYCNSRYLKPFFDTDMLYSVFLLILSNSKWLIKYDSKLDIIYDSSLVTPNELAEEVIDKFGDYIVKQDIEKLNDFEKLVVNSNYRNIYDSDVYLKRGMNKRDFWAIFINKFYPNGFKIMSKDFDVLNEFMKETFNIRDYTDSREIDSFITASPNYCLIDRGTYKARKFCVQLPSDLINKIIDYIIENKPTVYYISIYEKFKSELIAFGVDNFFYLKGLLDPELNENFITKRDYLVFGDKLITTNESLLKFIRTKTKFSIDDLKTKFPGVKTYVFKNLMYKEISNNLIQVENQNFIYLDKVGLSFAAIKNLKDFIDKLFIRSGDMFLSARKIYARLVIEQKDLLNDLLIVKSNFSLFSLIQCLFPNDYNFRRPLIFKDKSIKLDSQDIVIKEFVIPKDRFTTKELFNFMDSRLLNRATVARTIENFHELIADNYIRIDKETFIRKEKLGITEDQIKEIESVLDMIFDTVDQLNTQSFKGYQMFPALKFHWNKYLLVGIIFTYLSSKFEIVDIIRSNAIGPTDYIIERI